MRRSHRPKGWGSTYGDEGAGRGARSHPRCLRCAPRRDHSQLDALEPPYLPALGGRAGTFPPFDFVSGGTATRGGQEPFPHSTSSLGEQLRGAGRNLFPIRLRLWGNSFVGLPPVMGRDDLRALALTQPAGDFNPPLSWLCHDISPMRLRLWGRDDLRAFALRSWACIGLRRRASYLRR
jgi:hypothetical protein